MEESDEAMTTFILLLLAILPSPHVRTVDVDLLELNRIYTQDGRGRWYEQQAYYIYWRYAEPLGYEAGYHVVDWRGATVAPPPIGNVQEWYDHKTRQRLRVRHKYFVEVCSNHDREIAERGRLPEARRRKL